MKLGKLIAPESEITTFEIVFTLVVVGLLALIFAIYY